MNKTPNIWDTLKTGFTALAPMDGVTDIVFRQVVAHAARPDLFFTEFTNVSSFASEKGRANATARLATVQSDAPIIAQLWGKSPEHMAFTAQNLPAGFTGIDINMGCPEKHVVRSGGGSALILAPRPLSADLIASAKTSNLPVSVKTRLGYTHPDEWSEWLTHLLSQNLSALTIHLRTKKEMSAKPAHHELIPAIIALRNQLAPNTTLVFNGDFTTPAHFQQVVINQSGFLQNYPEEASLASSRQAGACLRANSFAKTRLDQKIGVMIGRGVFANPFCFEKSPKNHTSTELIALLHLHLDLFDAVGNPRKFEPLKRFFKIYINNFSGASDLRTQLMSTTSTDQVRLLLNTFML